MMTFGRYQLTRAFRWSWGVVYGPISFLDEGPVYADWHLGPVVIRRYTA